MAMVAIAVLVVIVVVVAGAAAYVVLTSGSSSTTTSTPPTTAATTPTTVSTVPSTSSTPSTTSTSSTPVTTSSTPMTTSTSSSESMESSFTCTSTYTTATTTSAAVDYTPQFIALIQQFSSIQFQVNGTENAKSYSESFGYTTTTLQSGIYNVSATLTANDTTIQYYFVVDSNNNSVISATTSVQGFSYTVYGAEAKSFFDGSMGLYGLNAYFTNEIGVFTDSAYFTNQGTSTQTFGTVSFPVTTYVANSANEVINYCGVSASLTSYMLSVGTPPGTSLQFLTYLHFAGTSQGNSEDITFQLTSMTVRS